MFSYMSHGKVQIKTTMRYHDILIKMTKIKSSDRAGGVTQVIAYLPTIPYTGRKKVVKIPDDSANEKI
jgi:hypothetical protein